MPTSSGRSGAAIRPTRPRSSRLSEPARQPPGPLVELAVGEGLAPADRGGLAGVRAACSANSSWIEDRSGRLPPGRAPLVEDRRALRLAEQGQARDAAPGAARAAARRRSKHPAQRSIVASSNRSALPIEPPAKPSPSSARARVRSNLAVPVSTSASSSTARPGQAQRLGRRVLQDEEHLEQRRVRPGRARAGAARRASRTGAPGGRRPPARAGGCGRGTRRTAGSSAGRRAAEGVDEEADQALDLGALAVRPRGCRR